MPNYTLDDGETVKNLLGATSHDQLERRETSYVRLRLWQIDQGAGPTGNFDSNHLKAIHRHLFQDVFEWAGHTRDERVPLADGTIATEPKFQKRDSQPFMLGPGIKPALNALAEQLRTEQNLTGLTRERFADRAADVMAELNGIHPFREGNGRTQRVFMEQLASRAGHDLDFTIVSRERMTVVSIAAHEQGDTTPMRRLFQEIVNPEQVAALRGVIDFLDRQGFKWNDVYLSTAEPGHAVEVTMGGRTETNFFGRTSTGIIVGKTADLPQPTPQRGDKFTLTPRAPEHDAKQARQEHLRDIATLFGQENGHKNDRKR